MSQLDVTISFSQLIGLIFFLYIFFYYVVILVIQYWYNDKLRNLSSQDLNKEFKKLDNTIILKRILKI